ncbi:hypothetical protein OGATHE_000199 [Ogataea polymorpha]|uniref:Uncharacterized protein n=1 Tax=Ogataea polymorpha TaxID=460523 RepID=A0A9P8TH68_9ASCO|nr:hypothetical protein OGATHE_000199 [Ogataea polymorpha]
MLDDRFERCVYSSWLYSTVFGSSRSLNSSSSSNSLSMSESSLIFCIMRLLSRFIDRITLTSSSFWSSFIVISGPLPNVSGLSSLLALMSMNFDTCLPSCVNSLIFFLAAVSCSELRRFRLPSSSFFSSSSLSMSVSSSSPSCTRVDQNSSGSSPDLITASANVFIRAGFSLSSFCWSVRFFSSFFESSMSASTSSGLPSMGAGDPAADGVERPEDADAARLASAAAADLRRAIVCCSTVLTLSMKMRLLNANTTSDFTSVPDPMPIFKSILGDVFFEACRVTTVSSRISTGGTTPASMHFQMRRGGVSSSRTVIIPAFFL